jgi:hypothetical protein
VSSPFDFEQQGPAPPARRASPPQRDPWSTLGTCLYRLILILIIVVCLGITAIMNWQGLKNWAEDAGMAVRKFFGG